MAAFESVDMKHELHNKLYNEWHCSLVALEGMGPVVFMELEDIPLETNDIRMETNACLTTVLVRGHADAASFWTNRQIG